MIKVFFCLKALEKSYRLWRNCAVECSTIYSSAKLSWTRAERCLVATTRPLRFRGLEAMDNVGVDIHSSIGFFSAVGRLFIKSLSTTDVKLLVPRMPHVQFLLLWPQFSVFVDRRLCRWLKASEYQVRFIRTMLALMENQLWRWYTKIKGGNWDANAAIPTVACHSIHW